MQIIIRLILFQRKLRGVVAHHSIIYCAVWKEERRRRDSLTQSAASGAGVNFTTLDPKTR